MRVSSVKIGQSLCVLFLMLFFGCAIPPFHEENARVFDSWGGRGKGIDFHPVASDQLVSPCKRFCAEYSWEEPDWADKSMLCLIHNVSGQRTIIGRSARGITATWVATQIGSLLLVKQHVDTHHNESFVVFPRIGRGGVLTYSVLYATPDQNICDSMPEGFPAEHIYTTIKHVSYNGLILFRDMKATA